MEKIIIGGWISGLFTIGTAYICINREQLTFLQVRTAPELFTDRDGPAQR